MCRSCYQGRGSLLHCLSTLTACAAVYFCCTGLGVTSTGRYPASCPMKPGLSSPDTFRYCQPRSPVLLITSLLYHPVKDRSSHNFEKITHESSFRPQIHAESNCAELLHLALPENNPGTSTDAWLPDIPDLSSESGTATVLHKFSDTPIHKSMQN